MSVVNLSEAVARRAQLDERMARCLKAWCEDLATGRAEGIAWAKNPANEPYLLNLWSHKMHFFDALGHRDAESLEMSAHEFLYELTREYDGDWAADDVDMFREQRGMDRPVSEAVADLAGIIGENSARRMVSGRRDSPRFLRGWCAGALDYWDAVRPDGGWCDEAQHGRD